MSASSGPCRALMLFSWREHFPTRKLRVNQFLLQTGEIRLKQHYSCKTLNCLSRVRQRCANSVMWHCERPASHRLKTQCRRIRTPPVRAPRLAKCCPRGQLQWTWSFAAKDRHLLNSSKKTKEPGSQYVPVQINNRAMFHLKVRSNNKYGRATIDVWTQPTRARRIQYGLNMEHVKISFKQKQEMSRTG